jgi:hypothetical protein
MVTLDSFALMNHTTAKTIKKVTKQLYLAHDQEKGKKLHCHDGVGKA